MTVGLRPTVACSWSMLCIALRGLSSPALMLPFGLCSGMTVESHGYCVLSVSSALLGAIPTSLCPPPTHQHIGSLPHREHVVHVRTHARTHAHAHIHTYTHAHISRLHHKPPRPDDIVCPECNTVQKGAIHPPRVPLPEDHDTTCTRTRTLALTPAPTLTRFYAPACSSRFAGVVD